MAPHASVTSDKPVATQPTPSPTHASRTLTRRAPVAVLLSQGKRVTASSVENADYTPARAAVDGNFTTTRWSSRRADRQWLTVDLGREATLSKVVLRWETAYAMHFSLERSSDSVTWQPMYKTTAGRGRTQWIRVSGKGRYVRITCTKRATSYGYSLWEIGIYGR